MTYLLNHNILRVKKDNLVLSYIILSPIIDLLTGILIFRFNFSEGSLGSPSQIFRIIFIFLFFSQLKEKQALFIFALSFWLTSIEIVNIMWGGSIFNIMSGLNYAIKVIFIFLLYFSSKNAIPTKFTLTKLIDCFTTSAFLYALGIIIPYFLGISIANYGEGNFGQKGLFASGNALGIYMGTACIINLLKIKKNKFDNLKSILIISAVILSGTKTSMVFLLFSLIVFIVKQEKNIRFLIIISILLVLLFYSDKIIELFKTIFDVIIFLYEQREDDLTFIVSGRNKYVIDAFNEIFKSNHFILKFIFGGGAFLSFRNNITPNMIFDTLETDPFDVLFMWGIIGLLFYLWLCYKLLYLSLPKKNFLSIICLFFVLHSIFAGHIIFEGIPMIIAAILFLISQENNSINKYYKYL